MPAQAQALLAPKAEHVAVKPSMRSAYAPPMLSKLGSIHELTLGTSNKVTEGGLRNL